MVTLRTIKAVTHVNALICPQNVRKSCVRCIVNMVTLRTTKAVTHVNVLPQRHVLECWVIMIVYVKKAQQKRQCELRMGVAEGGWPFRAKKCIAKALTHV